MRWCTPHVFRVSAAFPTATLQQQIRSTPTYYNVASGDNLLRLINPAGTGSANVCAMIPQTYLTASKRWGSAAVVR